MDVKIGSDVGGTFTDFLVAREEREPEIFKVLSTPGDPSIVVINGLSEIAASVYPPLSVEEFASTIGDGDFKPALGLFDGKDAGLNLIKLSCPDGKEVIPRNRDLITDVPRDTIYYQVASGGGGCGDARQRDRATLAREVRDGVISEEAAKTIYGYNPGG